MSRNPPLTRKGRLASVLALAAVLLLLVRPVCAAHELQLALPHGAGVLAMHDATQAPLPLDACCDAMQERAIAAPVSLAAPSAAALPQIPALSHAPLRVASALPTHGASPPPPPRYYTRSARIQR